MDYVLYLRTCLRCVFSSTSLVLVVLFKICSCAARLSTLAWARASLGPPSALICLLMASTDRFNVTLSGEALAMSSSNLVMRI